MMNKATFKETNLGQWFNAIDKAPCCYDKRKDGSESSPGCWHCGPRVLFVILGAPVFAVVYLCTYLNALFTV